MLTPTQVPQPSNIVTSRSDRRKAGISSFDYVDDYNAMQMAKYNNEYNYWLWQQQTEYNSPANQMQRAREAGLNPNVIAGNVSSGNAASPSPSSGRLPGNIRSNMIQSVNSAINNVNSLIGSIANGVGAVSKLSGIPSDIPTYRKMLSAALKHSNQNTFLRNQGVLLDSMLKQLDIAVTSDKNYVMSSDNWARLGELGAYPIWLSKELNLGYDTSGYGPSSRVAQLSQAEIDAAKEKINLLREQINNATKQGLHISADTAFTKLKSMLTEKQLAWFESQALASMFFQGLGAFSKLY